ncbi:MAG: hypothetical protein AAFR13_05065 [Pseudomonadota bacterium]
MRSVWFWAFVVGTASLVGSIVIINTLMPLMGQQIVSSMYWASFIGSYGIGSPVTWYCLRQNHRLQLALRYLADAEARLKKANADLADANRQLATKAQGKTGENGKQYAMVNGVVVR